MLLLKKMMVSTCDYEYTTGMAEYKTTTTVENSSSFLGEIYQGNESVKTDESGKYQPMEIAAWFLAKETMTHLKLQKLCYYAQAWFFTLKKIRLMDTEFQAWIHGPVSPELYEKFKCFGFSGIKLSNEYICEIQEEDLELLESVWETYGDRTGNALEALTHTERPWIEARTGYQPDERCEVVISLQSMCDYYSSIYIGGEA